MELAVGVEVNVIVGGTGVFVLVKVAVLTAVGVGVALAVLVAVLVGVEVSVQVAVEVGGTGVLVRVIVGDAVGVPVGEKVGVDATEQVVVLTDPLPVDVHETLIRLADSAGLCLLMYSAQCLTCLPASWRTGRRSSEPSGSRPARPSSTPSSPATRDLLPGTIRTEPLVLRPIRGSPLRPDRDRLGDVLPQRCQSEGPSLGCRHTDRRDRARSRVRSSSTSIRAFCVGAFDHSDRPWLRGHAASVLRKASLTCPRALLLCVLGVCLLNGLLTNLA